MRVTRSHVSRETAANPVPRPVDLTGVVRRAVHVCSVGGGILEGHSVRRQRKHHCSHWSHMPLQHRSSAAPRR